MVALTNAELIDETRQRLRDFRAGAKAAETAGDKETADDLWEQYEEASTLYARLIALSE